MLSSFLPGLRETRTAFTIGAFHLGWLVLAAAALAPESFDRSVFSSSIIAISEALGRPFLLSLLAFSTYTAGHLILSGVRAGSDWANTRSLMTSRHRLFTDDVWDRLALYTSRSSIRLEQLAPRLSRRTLLLSHNKDLYERMQTRRYAALLRFGIAPALCPIVIAGSFHVDWHRASEIGLAALAAWLTVMLWLEGIRELQVANAIMAGEVTSGRLNLDMEDGRPLSHDPTYP